ncbi:hypothetical protein Ae201684P_014812 [Aphanomyces euteiches]|nr:hypothetical protein Ae201684P_014812 [Aphanomyces euteiches]
MLTQVILPVLVALCSSLMYLAATTPSGESWNALWIQEAESKHANVSWMQDGAQETIQFENFGQSKSFCFLPNSTLPFRIDSLNDPRQPYIVQWLSEFKELDSYFEPVAPFFFKLQHAVTMIQPLIWGWSDLRIAISSESKSNLAFMYKTPTSHLCQILDHIQLTAYPHIREGLPDFLLYVLSKGGELTKKYCEGCSNGCQMACEEMANNPDTCIATLSPYQYPCVTVFGPETGILASQAKTPFTITFFSVISLKYVQNLVVGYILYFFSTGLARSRLFHYFLGATIGIVCSVALLLYQLYKQSQSTLRLLPGAGFLQSASLLTTVAFPVTGLMLLPTLYSILQWALGLLFMFWRSEEVLGIPHLGKFYFLFFGLVGMVLVWWFQWWAPSSNQTANEAIDDVDDDGVLEDIRRMESESFPTIKCVYAVLCSWLIVLVALLWSFLEALYAHVYYWFWSETPGLHSTLITPQEYAAQATSETEKALAELRRYLNEHPDVAESVREDNEVRLRRFMHGRGHMETTPQVRVPPRNQRWSKKKQKGDTSGDGEDLQRRLDEAEAQLREEGKLIDRLTRENQAKQEHIQSMEVALTNEIEKHQAIIQVLKDKELTQKQEADHSIDVLNGKMCQLQVHLESCSTLESVNASLRLRVDELMRQLELENKNHIDEIHAMRLDMFNHKMALEQTFRKSLQELDGQYLKKAFNAMADESKNALVANAKLKDELHMQSIGVENLMHRFKTQAEQYHKMKVENEILEKGSALRLKEVWSTKNLRDISILSKISALKTSQFEVERQLHEMNQTYLAREKQMRETSTKAIEDLKQENKNLRTQFEQSQKRCQKWKCRYVALAASRQQILDSSETLQRHASTSAIAQSTSTPVKHQTAESDMREMWSASLAPPSRCLTAPQLVRPDVDVPLKHIRKLGKLPRSSSIKFNG